jgi:hypothetical protein
MGRHHVSGHVPPRCRKYAVNTGDDSRDDVIALLKE